MDTTSRRHSVDLRYEWIQRQEDILSTSVTNGYNVKKTFCRPPLRMDTTSRRHSVDTSLGKIANIILKLN